MRTIDDINGLKPAKLAKSVFRSSSHISWIENARFRTTVAIMESYGTGISDAASDSILAAIEAAKTPEDACLVLQLSRLLLVDKCDFLLHSRSVVSYGLDSMVRAANFVIGYFVNFRRICRSSSYWRRNLNFSKLATT